MSNPVEDAEKDIQRAQRQQKQLLNEQTAKDKAELEQKRQEVFQQRLNIIHSERGSIWTPQGGYIPTQPKASPVVKEKSTFGTTERENVLREK